MNYNRKFFLNLKSDVISLDISDHNEQYVLDSFCLLYTSPSPRDRTRSRMPSSA